MPLTVTAGTLLVAEHTKKEPEMEGSGGLQRVKHIVQLCRDQNLAEKMILTLLISGG